MQLQQSTLTEVADEKKYSGSLAAGAYPTSALPHLYGAWALGAFLQATSLSYIY